jgi:thiamine-monophosphate kinase
LWGDGEAAILRAATAGDDYQIAFTAAPGRHGEVVAAAAGAAIAVSRIGQVVSGAGVELRLDGKVLAAPQPGYRHF